MKKSKKATHIAARVWQDQDMTNVVMDPDACDKIAKIIDDVLKKHKRDARSQSHNPINTQIYTP